MAQLGLVIPQPRGYHTLGEEKATNLRQEPSGESGSSETKGEGRREQLQLEFCVREVSGCIWHKILEVGYLRIQSDVQKYT
jgi:hypothetical protein